jgi:hydrogenase expression/formation protein HypC
MCIATPMRAKDVLDGAAICDHIGVQTYVDTLLLGTVSPGQWLLVHAGVAIQKLDDQDARLVLDALEAAARAQCGEEFEHLFADLSGREPQLPPHLQDAHDKETRNVQA